MSHPKGEDEDSSEDISITSGALWEEVDSVCCGFGLDEGARLMGEDSPTRTSRETRGMGIALELQVAFDEIEIGTSPSVDSESDSMRPRKTRILEGDETGDPFADGNGGGSGDWAVAFGRSDCCRGARVKIDDFVRNFRGLLASAEESESESESDTFRWRRTRIFEGEAEGSLGTVEEPSGVGTNDRMTVKISAVEVGPPQGGAACEFSCLGPRILSSSGISIMVFEGQQPT